MGHEEDEKDEEDKPFNPGPLLTPSVSPIVGLAPGQVKMMVGENQGKDSEQPAVPR